MSIKTYKRQLTQLVDSPQTRKTQANRAVIPEVALVEVALVEVALVEVALVIK